MRKKQCVFFRNKQISDPRLTQVEKCTHLHMILLEVYAYEHRSTEQKTYAICSGFTGETVQMSNGNLAFVSFYGLGFSVTVKVIFWLLCLRCVLLLGLWLVVVI